MRVKTLIVILQALKHFNDALNKLTRVLIHDSINVDYKDLDKKLKSCQSR